jgi:hypothetical protein
VRVVFVVRESERERGREREGEDASCPAEKTHSFYAASTSSLLSSEVQNPFLRMKLKLKEWRTQK